jgi:hypothetical protein
MRMKLNYLFLIVKSAFGLAAICSVSAQQIVPSVAWARFYQNSACTFGSVAQTADGGYILGGTISAMAGDAVLGLSDGVLVKIDNQGEIQWQKKYGGSGLEKIHSVRQTTDGGYVFAASTGSPPSGNKKSPRFGGQDAWVVKVDAEGSLQWEQTFGGIGNDLGASIWQTINGDYILAGSSDSPPSGNKESERYGNADGWVVKIDVRGNKQWDRSFGGGWIDGFSSVREAADGGYALAGWSSSSWLIKIDAKGNKQWEQSFDRAENRFFSMDQVDGGFILGGVANSFHPINEDYGDSDYWIVKVDASGSKRWDRSYGTPLNEELTVVRQTSERGYILGGNSGYPWSSIVRLIKTDSQGNQQWEETFGSSDSFVEAKDLQQTKDGGYIVCGSADYPTAGIPASGCDRSSWVANLENVVSNSGEVVTWKADAGLLLESVDDLNGEWKSDQTEVLSVGVSSAIALVPASQQRYYRLRETGPSSDSPSLLIGALLKWPVAQNQTLETASSKDGPWEAFSGEQGIIREAHYAIIPQNLRHHYFRTRKID